MKLPVLFPRPFSFLYLVDCCFGDPFAFSFSVRGINLFWYVLVFEVIHSCLAYLLIGIEVVRTVAFEQQHCIGMDRCASPVVLILILK